MITIDGLVSRAYGCHMARVKDEYHSPCKRLEVQLGCDY